MTIEQLFEWSKENNCSNYELEIQYRDGGGYYPGTESSDYSDKLINRETKIVTL